MIVRTFSFISKNASQAFALFAASLVVATVGSAALAANTWTVNLSEKELKLKNPTDVAWDKWFQTDIGYQRMIERNTPFIELTNNSTSTSPISDFHLSIGDDRFNFAPVSGSNFVQLGRTTPGFSLTSSTLNSGDDLVVNFGNGGLQPGQTVRFKVKIGIDSSFQSAYSAAYDSSVPDFRTVLFDMNGVNVYDHNTTNVSSADNAQAFVTFNPGGKSSVTVFDDEEVAASQFFNSNLRGSCCCTQDPVLIFQPQPPQIPEPGSCTLAMLGLASGLFLRRRPRRTA
jgi:hypothetical protein